MHYGRLNHTQPYTLTIQHTLCERSMGKPGSGYGIPQGIGTAWPGSLANVNNKNLSCRASITVIYLFFYTELQEFYLVSLHKFKNAEPKRIIKFI